MDNIWDTFLLLGGIGMFLFGINFMTDSLQKAAGNNLRTILEKMTKNPIIATLVGVFVTALIQSSGATSVMVISFMSAGLMNLSQGLFVMLGANIGTTITAQIISFKMTNIAPLILFVGVLLYLFIKNDIAKKAGGIVLGFGTLFVGIKIMGEAVSALQLDKIVAEFLQSYNNPFLGILFGIIFTAIIQSSSASVGILQVLAMSAGAAIGLNDVIYIVIGMNIGACSPVVIASFTGNKKSKQGALACFIAKFLGAAIFFALLTFVPIKDFIIKLTPDDVSRQIANYHLLFNLVTTILVMPFVSLIDKFVTSILPETAEESETDEKLIYLSNDMIMTPAIAIKQAQREIMRAAKLAYDNMKTSVEAVLEGNMDKSKIVFEREKVINFLNHEITGFLVKLHGAELYGNDIEKAGLMLRVISDVERIGDHAENIAEYAMTMKDDDIKISADGYKELKTIAEKSLDVVRLAMDVYENEVFDKLPEVSRMEEEVDDMQEQFMDNHIKRLKKQKCTPKGGVIFTDMVTDLERVSDHATNIAYSIKGEKTSVKTKKTYIVTRGSESI